MACNCVLSYLFNHEINNCLIYGNSYNSINNTENVNNDTTEKLENIINNLNNLENEINNLKKIISINKSNSFIYVLELDDNKYYIGKTSNPQFRISQHVNVNGSAWTKKYNVINLLELIPSIDDFDEDKYTLIYMKNKGINNVRGGTFTQIILDDNTIKIINKMLKNEDNTCFNCNKTSHFIDECPNKIKDICFNCKKPGHFSKDCKKINNFKCDFCERCFESKNGANYHAEHFCKNKPKK